MTIADFDLGRCASLQLGLSTLCRPATHAAFVAAASVASIGSAGSSAIHLGSVYGTSRSRQFNLTHSASKARHREIEESPHLERHLATRQMHQVDRRRIGFISFEHHL
jgi:hypothetical protein